MTLPPTCGGAPPTQWYMTEVAPSLPPWQQHPDRAPPVSHQHIDQGLISLSAFSDYELDALHCWAESRDKLAALAIAVRIQESDARNSATAERYLRIASRDDSTTEVSCTVFFCQGVPEAMFRLAEVRRVRDHEQRELLERALQLGFSRARYALEGATPPARDAVIIVDD